ncbi:MAG: cellulase family glycosylhydrolase [Pseudomonadota bacterium]
MLDRLHIEGTRFVDSTGREVLLRGLNLGGDCKLPYPDGGTHIRSDFSDHRQVSFVGRPFPLDLADQHLGRIAGWGFNCLRLLTTWEAIEHGGPGQLDQAYLDYFAEVCRRAGEHGLYVFIDFHQDVFSRMSGGSGAPGWVWEAMGLDFTMFDATDAALVMQHRYDASDPRPVQPERYPLMCWSRNYNAPANGVAWTLFFGGRTFAPHFLVDGINIQDHLQGHFLACQRAVAECVADLPNVLGFDTLNEPHMGFIGLGLKHRRGFRKPDELPLPGLSWSPITALQALAGHSVDLPVAEVSFMRGRCVETGRHLANPGKVRAWLPGCDDPFEREGVWRPGDDGRTEILKPDHFRVVDGREVDFDRDHMVPFIHRVAETVRAVQPAWMVFFEKDGATTFADPSLPDELPDNAVYAPHWYDLVTLMLKRFSRVLSYDAVKRKPVLGPRGILDMYVQHLSRVQRSSSWQKRQVPLLLGEFGIPFDLQGGRAYAAWGRGDRSDKPWRLHLRALDMTYDALDRLLLSSTQWNYTASNRNDPRIGDGWNQEDLSVFSVDQQADAADPDGGGRAVAGFVRPFVRRTQGRLTRVQFDRTRGRLYVELEADPTIEAPTEIFIPRLQFPNGYRTECDDLTLTSVDDPQRLLATATRQGTLRLALFRI